MKRMDALRKTRDSPLVVCMAARVMRTQRTHRVIQRSRDWFGRATATVLDLGDV